MNRPMPYILLLSFKVSAPSPSDQYSVRLTNGSFGNQFSAFLSPCLFITCKRRNVTLRLLQVMNRHGDRNAENWFPNDPFVNLTEYWSEGEGALTLKDKRRMYGIGRFIRQEYDSFLGNQFSPREVYARSS